MAFNHYIFEKTEIGNIIGRPVNPFDETHERYDEFETFAKEHTFYSLGGITPGLYDRNDIAKTKVSQTAKEIKMYKNSELDVVIYSSKDYGGTFYVFHWTFSDAYNKKKKRNLKLVETPFF